MVQDRALYGRVRREVDAIRQGRTVLQTSIKSIYEGTLLSSVFAETLRLHFTSILPVTPMRGALSVGKWSIPQGSYGMICTGVSHKNPEIWNTKNGLHPVDSFWADRFIVDPSDSSSGPVKPEAREELQVKPSEYDKPQFSSEGLNSTWFPFGGKLTHFA
jgi:hypothetical protein